MENNPEEPKKTKRGQSKEHMAEISKIGNEMKKKKGAITAYEKAKKKKEIEDKFAMIQNEISKQNSDPQIHDEEPEAIPVTKQRPPPITKKTKKVIEVVEESYDEESEESEEEEEVIVRKIVKKKPSRHNSYQPDNEQLVQKSNIELLRQKLNQDMKKRLMSSLFDC
jgi:hypothetical protein